MHLCKECVFDLFVIDNNANGFHSDERTVSGFDTHENLSILYRLFNRFEKEIFADLYGGFFHTVYRLFDKIENVSNTYYERLSSKICSPYANLETVEVK